VSGHPAVLLQNILARHNLADAMSRQLALEEPDKHISRHGVAFDAAMAKELISTSACAVSRQRRGTRGPVP